MADKDLSRSQFNKCIDLIECHRLVNRSFIEARVKVVVEKELSIFINGDHFATASVTPIMEREFVTGYLFGQGFIADIGEIESVAIDGNTAKVTVKDADRIRRKTGRPRYRIVSGGGKAAFSDEETISRVSGEIKINKNDIFRGINTVFEKAEIYKETAGVHASGLFTPEANLICLAEDMGRHNTLDKLVGYALINKIDCSNTFLASTGRMASEMVAKICRANIPVVATKTAITKSGLEIGEKYGLTIIGFVRDAGTKMNTDMETKITKERGMRIYTNPQRITGL